MNTNFKYSQRGIGVIEVMVAAVIFALGIVALIQLQGVFFKNSSAALARSMAATLAEEKLEDLRSFDDGTTFSYLDIDDNAGGEVSSGVQTIGNTEFTLTWDVTGFYYNAGVLTSIAPSDTDVEHKSVEISVAWLDTDGTPQTYTLDALINSNAGTSGGLLANSTGGSGEKPVIPHTELAAPDVLRVKVKSPPPESYDGTTAEWNALSADDKAKEYAKLGRCNVATYGATEAPDPDLNNNPTLDNVIVRFTSSKYQKFNACSFDYDNDQIDTSSISNTTELIKLVDEEFVTINCSCTLTASASGYDQSGASVAKALSGTKTGASNQQDEFCDLCCRDHHENTTGDYLCASGTNPENCLDPWRTDASNYTSGDHKHYLDSNLSAAVGIGDTYSEVCRIKRVDGFYRVIPDWRMIAHNVLVESDFGASTATASYESYLGAQINQALQGNAVTNWTYASAAVPLNGEQMMSRSIYLDYLTAAEIADAAPATSGDEVDINVNFYEYKTTQLGDWTTKQGTAVDTQTTSPCDPDSSTLNACNDSPTITAIVNNPSLDKGVFRYNASVLGDLEIVSTMGTSNSGVVSEPAIDTDDQAELSDSYDVDFTGGPPAVTRSVQMASSPEFTCPPTWTLGSNTYNLVSVNTTLWDQISLSCSPSSENLATCEQYAADTSSVAVSATLNTAVLSCEYTNSTYACPSITGLSGGDRLNVTGTYSCSVEARKSGSNLACDLVCE